MKFIQIISQTQNPNTREIFTHTKTINVSQILSITIGEGCNLDFCRIVMSNGEDIPIGKKSYHALIGMIQDKWEGVRVLPCIEGCNPFNTNNV